MNKILKYGRICLLITLIGHLVSCQQKKESPTALLFEETMDLHDVAMAKMGEIYKLKKSLTEKSDSLLQIAPVDSAQQEKFTYLINQLETADESMMSWMAQFETKYKDEDSEESLNYYEDQKQKILVVSKSMNEAIDQARKATQN